jgi:tetratricopeptide (TPR) repeat protein
MRAYVFTDRALEPQAGRFVWLSLDVEKAKNAALRQRLVIPALPTYLVLDPADERVALRWTGGATVGQLEKILADGRAAVSHAPDGPANAAGPGSSARSAADTSLALADRRYAAGDYAGAGAAYREAIAGAPSDWPSYPRAVESALFALSQSDQPEPCAQLGRDAYPRLRGTASAAAAAAFGLDCALQLPADHPQRGALVAALETATREVLADTSLGIAADDRSGVYIALLDARSAAGDSAGARAVCEAWAAFLEGAAARAANPAARVVFDSHRLSAYRELGSPERALPMLEASQRDFPTDYNAPARLAIAYRDLGRWDEALAASDRAMALAYGPRKLTIYDTRVAIFTGRGDPAGARRTLEEALRYAESLPPGQRSERQIASLKKRLEETKP